MGDRKKDIIQRAEDTIKSLSDHDTKTSSNLESMLIISKLLGDVDIVKWVKNELEGYPENNIVPKYRFITLYGNLRGGLGVFYNRQKEWNDPYPLPITEIEYLLGTKGLVGEDTIDGPYMPVEGKISPLGRQEYYTWWFKSDLRAIISKIRVKILDYLTDVIENLKYELVIDSIFKQKQKLVEEIFRIESPETISKLTSAFEELMKGNPESYSLALTSSRRMLKDLADMLFPAQKQLFKGREVTENKYINRLMAFLDELDQKSTEIHLIESEFDNLKKILDNLNELLNKGVHSKVAYFEAKRAVIYTFLIVADFLELRSI